MWVRKCEPACCNAGYSVYRGLPSRFRSEAILCKSGADYPYHSPAFILASRDFSGGSISRVRVDIFELILLIQGDELVLANEIVVSVLCLALSALMGWWWIVRRAPARQKQLEALKNATRLGEIVSAQRLLVIRAIDDEASLTLALGAIVNYVTARFITYVLLLLFRDHDSASCSCGHNVSGRFDRMGGWTCWPHLRMLSFRHGAARYAHGLANSTWSRTR